MRRLHLITQVTIHRKSSYVFIDEKKTKKQQQHQQIMNFWPSFKREFLIDKYTIICIPSYNLLHSIPFATQTIIHYSQGREQCVLNTYILVILTVVQLVFCFTSPLRSVVKFSSFLFGNISNLHHYWDVVFENVWVVTKHALEFWATPTVKNTSL